MFQSLKQVMRMLCVPVAVLGMAQAAIGGAPARFAGTYQLSDVVEDSSGVHFTLTVTVINSTETDIKGGIVALLDSQPSSVLIGQVGTIKTLSHLSQSAISHSFTISAAEYANWQRGHEPVLEYLVPNGTGTSEVRIQARRVVNPGPAVN